MYFERSGLKVVALAIPQCSNLYGLKLLLDAMLERRFGRGNLGPTIRIEQTTCSLRIRAILPQTT